MSIRRYINIVESIGIDGSVDPEDIINYKRLLKFAKNTAAFGFVPFSDFKPSLRSFKNKNEKFIQPEQRKMHDFSVIMNCLLTPSNGWLIKMNDATQLLQTIENLPENEKKKLFDRFREGHTLYRFDETSVDMYDLERCCQGVESILRPTKKEIDDDFSSDHSLSPYGNHNLSPSKFD